MNSFWKGVCSLFGSFKTKKVPREGWDEAFKKDAENIRKDWEQISKDWEQISKDWESVIGEWGEWGDERFEKEAEEFVSIYEDAIRKQQEFLDSCCEILDEEE